MDSISEEPVEVEIDPPSSSAAVPPQPDVPDEMSTRLSPPPAKQSNVNARSNVNVSVPNSDREVQQVPPDTISEISEMDTTTTTESGATATPNTLPIPKKAYLMDSTLFNNERLLNALKELGIEVNYHEESSENWGAGMDFKTSIMIFEEFSGPLFDSMRRRCPSRIYGPTILIEAADLHQPHLPRASNAKYPIYCRLLRNCKVGVTGVKSREILHSLHRFISYMDGVYMDKEGVVTHLVADRCVGSKYRGAVALGKPILKCDWLHEMWNQRNAYKFDYNSILERFKLPVFHGLKIAFENFDEPEKLKMVGLAQDNGGAVVQSTDPTVTHIVRGLLNNPRHSIKEQELVKLTPGRSADVSMEERNMMNPSPLKRPRFELQVLNDLHEGEEFNEQNGELGNHKVLVLKSEWFWSSIQIDACADETMYTVDTPKHTGDDVNCSLGTMSFTSPPCVFSDNDTPKTPDGLLASGGRRKRKRVAEFSRIDDMDSPRSTLVEPTIPRNILTCARLVEKPKEITDSMFSACLHAVDEVVSNPNLESMSKRHREFFHLLQTEKNYVLILHNIIKNFKEPCENEDQPGGRILDVSEIREIFGDLVPIYNLHRRLLYDLAQVQQSWTEDSSIGKVYCDHEFEFKKAYKQFINYFEECKAAIGRCEKDKPRFMAFIKIAQGRAEFGKQSLADLMIRPVQRLPSTALILDNLKKNTDESNPDYEWTAKALDVIHQANLNINEEKKRNEVLHAIYELDQKVDGLPPVVVSASRFIEVTLDVQAITDTWTQKFESITLFAFNDQLMVVKRRSAANKNLTNVAGTLSGSHRSPAVGRKSIAPSNFASHHSTKPYKFLELIPYDSIRRVVDVKDGVPAFGFIVREADELKERVIAFTTPDDPKWSNKPRLLDLFIELIAKASDRVDERTLVVQLHSKELKSRTGDNSMLDRASSFASKTRKKVTRALSFRSPTNKLKRTVSQMMSPFSSARLQRGTDPDTVSQCGSEMSTTPLRTNLSTISLWGFGSRRGLTDPTPRSKESRRTMSNATGRKIQPIEET